MTTGTSTLVASMKILRIVVRCSSSLSSAPKYHISNIKQVLKTMNTIGPKLLERDGLWGIKEKRAELEKAAPETEDAAAEQRDEIGHRVACHFIGGIRTSSRGVLRFWAGNTARELTTTTISSGFMIHPALLNGDLDWGQISKIILNPSQF